MNVCVINGSPKGETSITLQTVRYISERCPHTQWTILHAGKRIKYYETHWQEAEESLEKADLILFAYPVYTFIAPYQLQRFLELMKINGTKLVGKYATQITTSKHFYDVTAHKYIEENCADLGMKVICGLSADMDDLLKKEGQRDAAEFWKYVLFEMKGRMPKHTEQKISIVTNALPDDRALLTKIQDFRERCGYETEVMNIAVFPFKGGCLSCFNCATDGTCIYKDGFSDYLREKIQTCDATVYAFTIRDHSMGASFKLFDDRQFCNGHRTVTMGKPVGYLICGDYEAETNLQMIVEGRAQVGHNFLAGVAVDKDPGSMDALCRTLSYAMENRYEQPQNFLGVGGMKIFRDLIYVMGGMMKADHRFYKEHGFYKDMPHKQIGRILLMKLVGVMLSNPKLMQKGGSKMTDGMLMPYRKVLKRKKK